MKAKTLFGLLAGAAALETAAEILLKTLQKPIPDLPDEKDFSYYRADSNGRRFEDLYRFLDGDPDAPRFSEEDTYAMLRTQADYMNARYDCADFRAQLLFKIYKDHRALLSERAEKLIKDTFLRFKYFMDEPGQDSMCYWSENHQILFAAAEYLAGQEWPDETFSDSGMTGRAHMEKAKARIEAWMAQRFAYGFSEFLSNNYLAEDIAPMANLIAYCEDAGIVKKMTAVMDTLWLDVALNSVNNRFVSASARMYGNNKIGNYYGNAIRTAMNLLWGEAAAKQKYEDPLLSESEKETVRRTMAEAPGHIVLCFTDAVKKGKYTLPAAIREIALYEKPFVSKMGCGLSPADLETEGLVGQAPHQIMAQMGAETFVNPQVIENTARYFKANHMDRNAFVYYFKYLDLTLLRGLNLRKLTEKHITMPHGIAIGRGNIYTYRTSRYALSTAMAKDIGMCGAQDHEWIANLGETLTLFTTHPAGNGKNRFLSSPGYWIGNGRRPMSVQHENVNITIYKIPQKQRFGEPGLCQFTHAYFPKERYDEAEQIGNTFFGRKNGVYVALTANGPLRFLPHNEKAAEGLYKDRTLTAEYKLKGEFDLCLQGPGYHIWVTELSQAESESYDAFKKRILRRPPRFGENGSVHYETACGVLDASWDGAFLVNGQKEQTVYPRYENPFCRMERKASELTVRSENHTLTIALATEKREEN